MSYKFLGILDKDIAEYWNIEEHANKPILVFDDRIQHVKDNHLKDFGSIDEITKTYNDLHNIIKKPDYVFYNKSTQGLEYYKTLKDGICVAVRISNGKCLKVRSWYPANKNKITNRKKKELEEKVCE